MPLYVFLCECGERIEDICPIKDRKQEMECPKCGKMAPRNFAKATVGMKDNPRVSRAMGVHPSQIEAAMRKYPGSRYDKDGNLLIANRTEKKLRMKQRNYIEYD